MTPLSPATLDRLPAAVRRPAYDRERLVIGHVHIGVGAFHRGHQLDFVDDTLEARFGPWGVYGINLRPPEIATRLHAQQCLYTRTLRQSGVAETRVIGALRGVTEGAGEASMQALAARSVQVVTLTITEKGYGLTPASGAIDTNNPEVAADLAQSEPPRTALGLLAAGLARRAREGSGPLTLISCDNIPANGRRLRAGLTALIAASRPELLPWVEANIAFPNSMVDRIVPATTPADTQALAATLGLDDAAPVFGENFRQWVIEDCFAGERPPWDLASAEFVADAEPYEHIKMRVLNAAQSALSHWGALSGHEYSHQAASDPILAGLAERMLARETLPHLPAVASMPREAYLAAALTRIRNTSINHRCHQIGTDGSQKIAQRFLAPLRVRRAQGQPSPGLECALAGWIAYVAAGAGCFGARWHPIDPLAERVIALAERETDLVAFLRSVLAISELFGGDLAESGLAGRIAAHLSGLLGPDPHGHFRDTLARI